MKTKNVILYIITLSMIFLSGCNNTKIDTPKSHKISKEHVDNMNFNDSIEYHIDNNNEYLDFTLKNIDDNLIPLFYLNIDSNGNSGYENVNGAEYLIEHNNLFKYIGNGENWNWEYVSNLEITQAYGLRTTTLKVPKYLLTGLGDSFSSSTFLLNESWELLGRTSNVNYSVTDDQAYDYTLRNGDITIEINNSENSLRFTHSYNNIDNPHIRYFIDSDNNLNTGVDGYDYIIEDNTIYNYFWEIIGTVNFERDNNQLTTILWKDAINLGSNIRISAHVMDDNWNWQYYASGMISINNNNDANKKIFIIGDSTVKNPTEVGVGWGEKLSQYMLNPQNLFNLAQSGTSSKSYREQDWSMTKEFMASKNTENGAYLLIHFGHNDETDEDYEMYMKTYPGIGNSFYNELKNYVLEARNMGITPILMTPVERMEKVPEYDLFYTHIKLEGDYAQTVRDLSQNEGVLLLDLQDKSWAKFNTYRDKYELISIFGYGDDNSHFNSYGADVVSYMVKELICNSGDQTFCSQFR